MKTTLAVAVSDRQIPFNAATSVEPPPAVKPETQVFSPLQARSFLNAVKGKGMEAAFTVAVSVGMRQGEILGLRWSDVDLEAGTLTIKFALQRIDKKLVRVEPKTKTSLQTIQLPAICVSALTRHKADQDLERKWAGSRWQETDYVFTTKTGTPLDARTLLRDYYAITRPKAKRKGEEPPKLDFPPIRFHDLRHSAATLLLAQSVSPKYITELLGHSQVSFTMQTYAHVLPEIQREAASKMDEILNAAPVATNPSGLKEN
jgi:integrase